MSVASAPPPTMTAGQAVAQAMGQSARIQQMTEALIAARVFVAGLQHDADPGAARVLAVVDAGLAATPCTEVRHGPWSMSYDPPPIPSRADDWTFGHDDFDGAPTERDGSGPCDPRAGTAASIGACLARIAELEEAS